MTRFDDSDFLTSDQQGYLQSYSTEFNVLTREFIRMAIDAFMRSEGFAVDEARNEYYKDGTGELVFMMDERCERPGPDGSGGGRHYVNSNLSNMILGSGALKSYVGEFDEIRKTFEDWFDKFRGLPDPDDFVEVIDSMSNVSDLLAVGANGEGVLDDPLGDIEAYAAGLKGDAAETYRRNFVNQFDTVLDGHHGIATVIVHYLAAEKGVWGAARGDFIKIVVQATEAFMAAAHEAPNNSFSKVALTVAKTALDAAKLVFTPTTKGVEWALLAANGMSEVGQSPGDVESEYSLIRKRVLELFEGLDQQIRAVEDQIYENSGLNMDRVSGATAEEVYIDTVRANFKIVPVYLDPSRLLPAEISSDREIVRKILNCMNGDGGEGVAVIPTLTTAVNMIPDADRFVAPAIRGHDVGRGHYGPMLALNELRDMFADLVRTLRDDVQLCSDNYQMAYGIMNEAGDQAVIDVQTVLSQLDAIANPNGYDDPWRYDKTPAPNESFRRMYKSEARLDLTRMYDTQPGVSAPPDAVHTDLDEVVPDFQQ